MNIFGMENTRAGTTVTITKYWLVGTAITVLFYFQFSHEWQLILETYFYFVLILIVAKQKAAISIMRSLPLPYRVFLILFVLLLCGTQLMSRNDRTFPFVQWAMFGHPVAVQPQYYDYTAILQSGQEFPLNVNQFRSLGRRVALFLSVTANQITHHTQQSKRQALIARYENTLRAIVSRYNFRNAHDPIKVVQIWLCTLRTASPRDKVSADRRLFRQVLINTKGEHRAQ